MKVRAADWAASIRSPRMELLVSITSTAVRRTSVVESAGLAVAGAVVPSIVTATLSVSTVASGGTETRICRPSSVRST